MGAALQSYSPTPPTLSGFETQPAAVRVLCGNNPSEVSAPLEGDTQPTSRTSARRDGGRCERGDVGFVMWTEHEKLKTIGACLKGADDRGPNPDRVKHSDIGDLVIELDTASAARTTYTSSARACR